MTALILIWSSANNLYIEGGQLEKMRPITCLGGANVDRKAKIITHGVRLQSSNPVTSITSCGGVARNIAEYLGRLGCHSRLITYIGNDNEGDRILREAAPYIDLRYVYVHPTENTGSYTAILDQIGDLVIGVADMGIYDAVSLSFIDEHWDHIISSQCIILDTNFPTEVIADIIARCDEEQVSLCVVPGSEEKVTKLSIDHLQGISWLILNKVEAQILSGIVIESFEDCVRAVERLIGKGVQKVVITRGEEGVLYRTAWGEEGCITSPRVEVADVTGAGDAFVCGLLYADSKGIELERACKYGMCCSLLSLQTHETVPSHLNEDLLIETYRHYFGEEKNHELQSIFGVFR